MFFTSQGSRLTTTESPFARGKANGVPLAVGRSLRITNSWPLSCFSTMATYNLRGPTGTSTRALIETATANWLFAGAAGLLMATDTGEFTNSRSGRKVDVQGIAKFA